MEVENIAEYLLEFLTTSLQSLTAVKSQLGLLRTIIMSLLFCVIDPVQPSQFKAPLYGRGDFPFPIDLNRENLGKYRAFCE